MSTIPQVAEAMQQVLTMTARTLGRETGFVQRASQLDGASFVQAWIFAVMATPMPTWEDVSQSAATIGAPITAQGLEQRCDESAAHLLEEVLAASVAQVIAADPVAIPLLARFTSLFIDDSTTIVLPPLLDDYWRGTGKPGSATAASLKLQVRLDLSRGALWGPALQNGRACDAISPLRELPIVAGALYLADLGYWSLARFAALDQAGAFWLSRYLPYTTLFTEDGRRWDEVVTLLEEQGKEQVDLAVTVGIRARLPARLVALRVPKAVAEQRRQRLRQEEYPQRSLVKAAELIQKHAMHLASSLWSLTALENALNVIRDGLWACCRMNSRHKRPNTYQLLLDPDLFVLA